jgi:plasmid stabilization system protein ParE
MTVKLTEEAERDLFAIIDHIGIDNPAAARKVYHRIMSSLRHLGRFPRMGPATGLPEVRTRNVPRYAYKASYRIEGEDVLVLRVWDGRRGSEPFSGSLRKPVLEDK